MKRKTKTVRKSPTLWRKYFEINVDFTDKAASATWTLGTGVSVLQCVAAGRAGGDELGHLTLTEAGLEDIGEMTGAKQLCLPLCIRAPG